MNALVAELAHGGIAYPIDWTVLGHDGGNAPVEQIEVLDRDVFAPGKIRVVMADRVYRGGRDRGPALPVGTARRREAPGRRRSTAPLRRRIPGEEPLPLRFGPFAGDPPQSVADASWAAPMHAGPHRSECSPLQPERTRLKIIV